jgi:hypothetical protein
MSISPALLSARALDRQREAELFRVSARSTLSPPAGRHLDELLAEQIDWRYVLSVGGLHGVLPLMNLHLGSRETVPAAVRRDLQERSERVARSNLYLSAQLTVISDALDRAGCPAVVLKGPAVAATLYPSLSLREFGDLDLLVRRTDLAGAMEVVRSLGFVPWRTAAGAQEEAMHQIEYSLTFTRPSDDLDLDMHWDVARSFFTGRVEAEALWTETTGFTLHGRELRGLSPTALLLALCVHGAKHGPFPWPRLKWICDIAEFVRSAGEFDWDAAVRRSEELGCRRTMLLGLALSRPLLDHPLPEAIEAELGLESRVEDLAARIWVWLSLDAPVSLSFKERVAIDMTLIDSGAARLSYAVRRLFTPTQKDWGSTRLPGRFGFLYMPIRIARLSGQYVRHPGRLRLLLRRSVSSSDSDGTS